VKGQNNSLLTGYAYCMHAYVVTPEICKLMLKKLFPISHPVDRLFYDRSIMQRSLIFSESIFYQSDESGAVSDIQPREIIESELTDSESKKFGKCIS